MAAKHLRAILSLLPVLLAACQANESAVLRYGFARDRVGLAASGWDADNRPESGHATDFEDHYDYSRITIGLMNNFIRAYLWKVDDLPGVRKPGRITFRLRRLGRSSKIILQADGQGVCTYLQRDPERDRYEITGCTNEQPRYWGGDAEISKWHDYSFIYDGEQRFFEIDGDPATRLALKIGKSNHADHLSLGMGYEYGKEMYIDIARLVFAPLGAAPAGPAPSPRPDGGFVAHYEDGVSKWVQCSFRGSKLDGMLRRWHPNGWRKSAGSYVDGKPDGEWIWWYANGRERLRLNYAQGVLHGPFIRFYPDGQVETSVRFVQGQADGLFARWFPEGTPQFVGGYKMNAMHGHWAKWDRQGRMLWAHMSTDGKHDVFVKTWYRDGTPKLVKYLERGQNHGAYVEYHPNGRVKVRGAYSHGEKSGTWATMDETGKVIRQERHAGVSSAGQGESQ